MLGLRQDALDWFVRRNSEAWSATDEAQFQRWLNADEDRVNTWERWESHWKTLDSLPADAISALRANLARDKALASDEYPEALGPKPFVQRPPVPPRRRSVQLAFATLAFVVVGGLAWRLLGADAARSTHVYATQRGQQSTVDLPDGSRLQLDTATTLEVAYRDDRREIRLREGQAVFTVHPDAARPFDVLAGAMRVTAVGTQFSVRLTPDVPGATDLRVAVEEGKVRVGHREQRAGAETGTVYLVAGQQLSANAQGVLAAVTAVPDGEIAPWRQHRVSFVDVPLSQALAELERYGSTGVIVRNPGVAALRLSGTFDPRDPQTLRNILPAALPVRLQKNGDVFEAVPAR